MTTEGNLKGRLEAILFVAGEPVEIADLARALDCSRQEVTDALTQLRDEYDFAQRGFCMQLFGEHAQLATRSLYAEDIVRLLQPVQKQSLSQSALETLAVIAYRQPVTKAEIEAIRGVKCDYSVQSLTAKGLIEVCGRKETLGRPMMYATTDEFLRHFGLESLEDLPDMPDDEAAQAAELEAEELVP